MCIINNRNYLYTFRSLYIIKLLLIDNVILAIQINFFMLNYILKTPQKGKNTTYES